MSEQVIRAKSNVTKGITKVNAIPRSLTQRAELLRVIKKTSKYDLIWYASFVALGFLCLGLFFSDWRIYLTVARLFLFLVVANLIARGKVLGIWLNFLDCCLYGVICFVNGVYGDMFTTLIISNAFNVYGVISWGRNGEQKKKRIKKSSLKNQEVNQSASKIVKKSGEIEVRQMSKKMSVVVYVSMAACIVAAYFALDAVGTNMAYFGCFTLVMNIFVKYLSMARYRENWWISIIKSTISLVMWLVILVQGVKTLGDWSALPTVGAGLACLTNDINGCFIWNKLYSRSVTNGGAYLAMRPVHIKHIAKLKRSYKHMTWSKDKDYVPSAEEIALNKRIQVASYTGMFRSA